MMYIYQRLRDLREDNDKKQEDIALILEITRQQYQLYESGKRELPMHHFITLARYYNVSLDYLAGLTDTPKKLYWFYKTVIFKLRFVGEIYQCLPPDNSQFEDAQSNKSRVKLMTQLFLYGLCPQKTE